MQCKNNTYKKCHFTINKYFIPIMLNKIKIRSNNNYKSVLLDYLFLN